VAALSSTGCGYVGCDKVQRQAKCHSSAAALVQPYLIVLERGLSLKKDKGRGCAGLFGRDMKRCSKYRERMGAWARISISAEWVVDH
jgi:hypothetical protein